MVFQSKPFLQSNQFILQHGCIKVIHVLSQNWGGDQSTGEN
jgi:hypothetical protein